MAIFFVCGLEKCFKQRKFWGVFFYSFFCWKTPDNAGILYNLMSYVNLFGIYRNKEVIYNFGCGFYPISK
jgi:hypothetical protein